MSKINDLEDKFVKTIKELKFLEYDKSKIIDMINKVYEEEE